jgi:hypothetical protein
METRLAFSSACVERPLSSAAFGGSLLIPGAACRYPCREILAYGHSRLVAMFGSGERSRQG